MVRVATGRSVNNSIYDRYGERWYTAFDDPIALLRAESRIKVAWMSDKLEAHGITRGTRILDVGCGGGFISNALALRGYRVTGIDLSAESLRVAELHDSTRTVEYRSADAYELPFSTGAFDAVASMDFLEHVEDPDRVILECARVLKPGGLFVFHTFNRNPVAWLIVIKLVEWLVKNTPPEMHVLRLFIKPAELVRYCQKSGLDVQQMLGVRPIFSSIPLKSVFSGVVPPSLRFGLTRSLLLSYMGFAVKSGAIRGDKLGPIR